MSEQILVPSATHDLRGAGVMELSYPAGAVLLVAGVPGAGKSTLLHRVFGPDRAARTPVRIPGGPVVVDSQQSRNWWTRWLAWLPYPLWRPLMHCTHHWRVRAAIMSAMAGQPVVVHDCGTRWWIRSLIARWAARRGRPVHLILLDVPAPAARAGQHARRRLVGTRSFRTHCRRWARLLATTLDRTRPARPGVASVVVIDRCAAGPLRRISFPRWQAGWCAGGEPVEQRRSAGGLLPTLLVACQLTDGLAGQLAELPALVTG